MAYRPGLEPALGRENITVGYDEAFTLGLGRYVVLDATDGQFLDLAADVQLWDWVRLENLTESYEVELNDSRGFDDLTVADFGIGGESELIFSQPDCIPEICPFPDDIGKGDFAFEIEWISTPGVSGKRFLTSLWFFGIAAALGISRWFTRHRTEDRALV